MRKITKMLLVPVAAIPLTLGAMLSQAPAMATSSSHHASYARAESVGANAARRSVPTRFPAGTWRPVRYGIKGKSSGTTAYICTYLASNECEKGNGQFNDVTINSAGSAWTVEQAGACNYCYMIDSTANNCQFETENADHGVQDGANPCDQSKSEEVVEVFSDGNHRCTMYNTGEGEWYGVWHLTNGSSVEGWPVQGGFDTGWHISAFSAC